MFADTLPKIFPVYVPRWDIVVSALASQGQGALKIRCFNGSSREFSVEVEGITQSYLSVSDDDNNLWWVELFIDDADFAQAIGPGLPIMLIDFDSDRGFLIANNGLGSSTREELEAMIDEEVFDKFRHGVFHAPAALTAIQLSPRPIT